MSLASTADAAQSVHDLAAHQIARTLLSWRNGEVYPGFENPGLATYVNVPVRRVPIQHNWEGELYPDIVVVDPARTMAPRLVAEVETEESIAELTLDKVWKLDMDVCPNFYLFVPTGSAEKAADLLLEFRTMTNLPRALYTYSFDALWRVQLTAV
jgi:hypothetical protein